LANDGPNPEYPWPHKEPEYAPVTHHFEVWSQLTSVRGRNLVQVVDIAVEHFPEYADA
jgi:hypothetical protein